MTCLVLIYGLPFSLPCCTVQYNLGLWRHHFSGYQLVHHSKTTLNVVLVPHSLSSPPVNLAADISRTCLFTSAKNPPKCLWKILARHDVMSIGEGAFSCWKAGVSPHGVRTPSTQIIYDCVRALAQMRGRATGDNGVGWISGVHMDRRGIIL